MAKIRAEIAQRRPLGTLKDGADPETVEVIDGILCYVRNAAVDDDPVQYIEYGDRSVGPRPHMQLLGLSERGELIHTYMDAEGHTVLAIGDRKCTHAFDRIRDDHVEADDDGNLLFVDEDDDMGMERVIHGAWCGKPHEAVGNPVVVSGTAVFVACDNNRDALWAGDALLSEPRDRLWITGVEEHVNGATITCAASQGTSFEEIAFILKREDSGF